MESHASLESNNSVSAEVTDLSVSVSYDNTTKADVGVGVNTEDTSPIDASADVTISVKTGTEANASAGLDGNNVYADVHYSDTNEVKVDVNASVNK